MRRILLPLALAATVATAAPPAAMPVPPVTRWATLPRLAYRADYKPRPLWVARAQALDGSENCRLPADVGGVVRLNVPFAVLLGSDGKVLDAHADAPDCPALAALVEQFARQLGPRTLQPPEGTPPLWRASHFLAGWRK